MKSKVKETYKAPAMHVVAFSPECIVCNSVNALIWQLTLPSSVSSPSEEFGRTDYGEANII
ncbi:MAG: hypothetical protein IK113_10000 [Bacteroidales bacterium]|nr:hypothetical protein [Bacteroidales bacterium]